MACVVCDRVPMYVVTVTQLELSYLLPSVSVSVSEPVVESSPTHSVSLSSPPELPFPTDRSIDKYQYNIAIISICDTNIDSNTLQ